MHTLFTAMKKCTRKTYLKYTKVTASVTVMNYKRIIFFSPLLGFSEINVLGSYRIF